MKTRQKLNKNARSGSATLTVLGLVSLICLSGGYMTYTASQEMHMSRVLRESLKAKLIAESGLNTAYKLLITDFSRATGLRLESPFGAGNYIVTSIPDPNSTKRFQLISNGTCGTYGKFKVAADVENRTTIGSGSGSGSQFFPLAFDILVGGIMDLKGNFNAEVGTIHANGNITSKGSSSLETTLITSAGKVTLFKFTGPNTVLQYQPPVDVRPADLTAAINALKAHAEKNGAKYADSADIPANPPGGVAWCTSDGARWIGSGTGCFIFEGDASLQGGGRREITAVDGYPAIIVLGTGEVKINAQTIVNGAILVPNGSIFLVGTAEFHGPVLVGQTFTGSGTAELFTSGAQGFSLPPVTATTDNVIITAWH
jgi:hypothetical protein